MNALISLLTEIRGCRECEAHLPLGPRPTLSASSSSKVLIIGQAPGVRVHESGVPWDDPSGKRLRDWMGVTDAVFYNVENIALIPMGFCYPGTGNGGDLPPRPECAELWHKRLIAQLRRVGLTLLIGRYAQDYVLGDRNKASLTATVRAWKEFRPMQIPLPHPSPRNNRWLKNNPWFENEVVPYLRRRVNRAIS